MAVLVISSLLAWAITRSLTEPLNRATRAAEAIANGRLDNHVATDARDEPGRLLVAMDVMQQQLQRFSSETARMIELHADKDMSHRMPIDFPGVYGELSKGINTMMFEHLDAIVDAIAVLNEYANLVAMDVMQQQLQRFSSETARMIELHADKDMSHRMPIDFPGVYGELSKGINTMMFEHLDAIVDAIAVLNEYANGNLRRDARRLPGSRAVLHESMDAAKASLLAINTEIKTHVACPAAGRYCTNPWMRPRPACWRSTPKSSERLAAAAAAGDFSARGKAEQFQHDFRLMVQDLNAMMQVSDSNLGKLSALLQSIAAGDLTARMHGDFQGVFAQMRDDANTTADQLTDIVGRIQTAATSIKTSMP